jgi:hypothetical protein
MYTSIPTYALTGSPPYTILLPMPVYYEFLPGFVSTAGLDTFTTARAPHWNPATGTMTTTVFVRTATPNVTTITGDAQPGQNYVDVASATGLAVNDYVVLDDGTGQEEYRRIGIIEGTRVFFTTPASYAQLSGLRFGHEAGDSFKEVTFAQKVAGTDFSINGPAGSVTELTEFGDGAKVVLSYTTDFVVPDRYPTAPFDSPDIDDAFGEWANQLLSEGTYTLTAWGYRQICVTPNRTTVAATGTTCPTSPVDLTSYRGTSPPAKVDFLLGVTPGTVHPYANISGAGATCNKCHNDVFFHGGGRRGFETCISCHGVAGSELSIGEAGAPSSVKFSQFLHEAHEPAFPSQVGGVRDCTMCHGTATNWKSPPPKIHSNPTVAASIAPVRSYSFACMGCHQTPAAIGHFDSMTAPNGQEACATCHDSGRIYAIDLMHKTW